MSYIALYRKYRPSKFEDIIGQNHIIDILKNQIINDKISHAYIFSGTRGTGKTTAAKVFAKAVNCLNRKGAEPCNECEACKAINSGATTDVIEMDAASNNSVDNIRSIRQEVMYCTTGLKYKVYIIDEVHMLSTSAFNALLKTLEEPPKNVIFILATTEEHKILPTILSRCMRFEFRKINQQDIIKRLEYVAKDSKIEIESEALKYIANLSNGGLRDALSILERLIDSDSNKISYSKVENLVGMADKEKIQELSTSILEYNLNNSINILDNIIISGRDTRYICQELVNIFLDKLIENVSKNIDDNSIVRLNYCIKELSKLDSDIRQSINGDILLKSKIAELCSKKICSNEKDLLDKIESLELRIYELENRKINNIFKEEKKEKVETKTAEDNNKESKKENDNRLDKVLFKEMDKLKSKIVESDNLQLYSALSGTKIYRYEDCLAFETENKFAYGMLSKDSNKKSLEQAVLDILGQNLNIKIEYNEKVVATHPFEEYIKDEKDIKVTIED